MSNKRKTQTTTQPRRNCYTVIGNDPENDTINLSLEPPIEVDSERYEEVQLMAIFMPTTDNPNSLDPRKHFVLTSADESEYIIAGPYFASPIEEENMDEALRRIMEGLGYYETEAVSRLIKMINELSRDDLGHLKYLLAQRDSHRQ